MKLTSLSAAPGRRERRLVRPSGLTGERTGSQLIAGVRRPAALPQGEVTCFQRNIDDKRER